MSDPNDDLKNQMGNEYDLYSSLKDKFQGFDKNGDAVFKDDTGVSSFAKSDFGKMNAQLQKDFGNKSYEDTFNENQYKDLTAKGNKFQGFAGDNAIFRNEQGDLENFGSEGGFASFLKKQQPDTQFDIAKQGSSGRSSEGYNANQSFLNARQGAKQNTGSGFTGYNPQQKLDSAAQKMMNPGAAAQASQPSTNPAETMPKVGTGYTPAGQGMFSSFAEKQPAPIAPKSEPPPTLGGMLTDMAKDKAQSFASGEANAAKSSAIKSAADTAGISTQALTDPAGYAKTQATNAAAQAAGLPTNAFTDPKKFAEQQAINAAASSVGVDPSIANVFNGNISQNIQDLAKKQALSQAGQYGQSLLSENDPTGGALSGLGQYAGLLNGNVASNVGNLAVDKAKQEATNQALMAAGIDPTGGMASGAMNTVKALFGGGSSQDKGSAAAQAAAKAALGYFTGGVVSPESIALASSLSNKAADKIGGTGGSLLRNSLGTGLDLSGKALSEGLDVVGKSGARYGRDLSTAGTGVKQILKGNIGEGLKGLGSAASQALIDSFIKAPLDVLSGAKDIAGQGIHAAGLAVGKVLNAINPFCFTPNTEILMANGTYKKIKLIKLHDEIMLGGKVTAIGQSTSSDLYVYDGVEVSGGHTLYENGKWMRVKDSKYAVKLDVEDALVFPMDTENHLIVTKGQIWADMSEVDNTYDKTDTDILAELNGQHGANRLLDVFLNSYFKKKK